MFITSGNWRGKHNSLSRGAGAGNPRATSPRSAVSAVEVASADKEVCGLAQVSTRRTVVKSACQ